MKAEFLTPEKKALHRLLLKQHTPFSPEEHMKQSEQNKTGKRYQETVVISFHTILKQPKKRLDIHKNMK